VRRRRGLLVAVVLLGACGADGSEGAGVSESTEPPATTAATVTADAIPVAYTPDGGWTGAMPAPVLADCTEPLVAGAPDLAGLWAVVEVEAEGQVVEDHPALGAVQRVEQCGDRLVVTASGIIHDMRVDGTEANGVHDVAEFDKTTPITVVATYEDGVHVLRPVGLPLEVTRRRDGAQMVWDYLRFTARLDRIGEPTDPYPANEEPS
jgi:hypothetical protein